MKIVVIDYNLGNPNSIVNILKKIGYEAIVTNSKDEITTASHIILPGVGHFYKAIENLNKLNIRDILDHKVLVEKTPILGICLGMQLMTNFSEEGNVSGFKWVNASVHKFSFNDINTKIPHMGWNEVDFFDLKNLFNNVKNPRFYFVHSYYVVCIDKNDVLTTTNYEECNFVSGFKKDNIVGVQFHPEKSHKFGFEFFKAFLEIEKT